MHKPVSDRSVKSRLCFQYKEECKVIFDRFSGVSLFDIKMLIGKSDGEYCETIIEEFFEWFPEKLHAGVRLLVSKLTRLGPA